LATPRGRCHGIYDEHLRQGAETAPCSRLVAKHGADPPSN